MAKNNRAAKEQPTQEVDESLVNDKVVEQSEVSGIVTDTAPMTISTESVTVLSQPVNKEVDESLVKIRIKYPEDYSGKRFFNDGDIKEVAPETAQQFIDKNIAERAD